MTSIVVNYHPEDITTIANGTCFNGFQGRFFDSGGNAWLTILILPIQLLSP
ncbi:MAG: hypothetical protein R2829_10230 [Bacteroidia bacterium]